ncbi:MULTISPECIES: hypothetical protein [unclassified Haloferax]|uniref:hypothetical protein n=1 Tax=unclassified Haloferax TaxID=2625095 RepID=UPI0012673A76|nr:MULTISPECIES: hypothetical protein [unclassified Haloferax]
MPPEITFGPSATETVLEQFGKTVDEENYIIDQETEEREKSYYKNEEIHIDEFAGVIEGSVGFIKDDFTEIHAYVKDNKNDTEGPDE